MAIPCRRPRCLPAEMDDGILAVCVDRHQPGIIAGQEGQQRNTASLAYVANQLDQPVLLKCLGPPGKPLQQIPPICRPPPAMGPAVATAAPLRLTVLKLGRPADRTDKWLSSPVVAC
jgi:hypothetical protein